MRTTGETVYECKDKNRQCAFARDTEANLQTLAHLSHARSVHDCAHNKTLYLTETRETGNRRRMPCMRLFLHNCLLICRLNTSAPQTGTALTALQTPRKCYVHNCAPSASGTSQVLRSPFVNNSFHEQGTGSRPLRDKRTTAALADV